MSNTTIPAEIVQALLTATDDRRDAALRALRGENTNARQEEGPLLYSVAQAATRLNVSRCTVWRILRARGIKKVELYPGCERIRRADIDALAGAIS